MTADLPKDALKAAKRKLDETFSDWRKECSFDLHYLLEQCITAYEYARATAPGDGLVEFPPVERIEMVSYENGYKEATEPTWRVRVGEYCTDFETETAANNFRGAIEALVHSATPRPSGDALVERVNDLTDRMEKACGIFDFKEYVALLRAAARALGARERWGPIETAPRDGVPEGFVLVPKEPTTEMVDAAINGDPLWSINVIPRWVWSFKRAIAASPRSED